MSDSDDMLAFRIRIGVDESTGSEVVAGRGDDGKEPLPEDVVFVRARSLVTDEGAGDNLPLTTERTDSNCFEGESERGVDVPPLAADLLEDTTDDGPAGFRLKFDFALLLTCALGLTTGELVADDGAEEGICLTGEAGRGGFGLPGSTFAMTCNIRVNYLIYFNSSAYLSFYLHLHLAAVVVTVVAGAGVEQVGLHTSE